jgi:hypothetical protein
MQFSVSFAPGLLQSSPILHGVKRTSIQAVLKKKFTVLQHLGASNLWGRKVIKPICYLLFFLMGGIASFFIDVSLFSWEIVLDELSL